MKKMRLFAFTTLALLNLSSVANADTPILLSDDFVGISFQLVSLGCLAATVFFLLERGNVPSSWRVSITVAGLVTGVTFIHYLYMGKVWNITGVMPTVHRYVEWLITMPLLILQFYFILKAAGKRNSKVFWRLLISSIAMVVGGYLGEANYIPSILGFIICTVAWIYILYEVFSGDAGKIALKIRDKAFVNAFNVMRVIVTVGWAIYPLGYALNHLTSGIELNAIYNLADFLNKIIFSLIIYVAATQHTSRPR
tara:strand:+ start:1390 stop:2148 length:759 start_codon:yes stop_codon:yes gene_type:complete